MLLLNLSTLINPVLLFLFFAMNLLIIDVNPFGMLTDVVKWTQYLSKQWNISLLCFSSRNNYNTQPRAEDIKLIEVHNYTNRHLKAAVFILRSFFLLLFYKGKVVIEYFPYCELLKCLFPRKAMMLDIRTMSVNPDDVIRNNANRRIRHACKYFDKVTAISEGVASQLGRADVVVLPLGSDIMSSCPKIYNNGIRLLYIGILTNRRIGDSIEGVVSFHTLNPSIPISYTIIGYGAENEENHIRQLVKDLKAEDYVLFVGRKRHEQLSTYIDNSNVGLSFVPMTDYFDFQPPTKTFEYCLSGLYCIATGTSANREFISSANGVIIEDSPQGVLNGLTAYWHMSSHISEASIRKSLISFTWENIVNRALVPVLSSL